MKFLLLMAGILFFLAGCNQWATNRMHFDSNGERIYFTATSERETLVTYTGDPAMDMMMMGDMMLVFPVMEMAASGWREKLISGVKGKVLEVGIGTGRNIPYYPANVELTGIDFSPKMVEIARKKAKSKSKNKA